MAPSSDSFPNSIAAFFVAVARLVDPDGAGGRRHEPLQRGEQLLFHTPHLEEKYRGIFENATIGIFQTTADGHYLSCNPALAAIYRRCTGFTFG